MDDETLQTTAKGISALKRDADITPLQMHVLFTCIGAQNTMLDIVDSVQQHSKERKFLEPIFVAKAVQALIIQGYLIHNIPVVAKPVKYIKENKYARR